MEEVSLSPQGLRLLYGRGGNWWTKSLSQRLGSVVALTAIKVGVSPNQLSVLNALLGVATSFLAITAFLLSASWVAGLIAFVGFQIAYGFDCADGQVARATNRTSVTGAKLDLLCDFVVQLGILSVVAITVMATLEGFAAGLIILIIAGGWFVPLLTEALSMPSVAPQRRVWWFLLLGGLRDYGFYVSVIALLLALRPEAVVACAMVVAALHYLFFARLSWVLYHATIDRAASAA